MGLFRLLLGRVPTIASQVIHRGDLTKAGAGGVSVSAIMVFPDPGVGNWTITSGNSAAHWTVTAQEIVPTTTGAAAHLNLGPYILTMADSVTGLSGQLTINIRANTYTISKMSEVAAVCSGGDGQAASINGKTVEFARYATDFALATFANPITFLKWRCSGVSRCTIQHEDYAHPSTLANIQVRLCQQIDFVSIRVNPATRIASTDKAWYVRSTTPSADAVDTNDIRWLDTHGSCGVDGTGVPALNVTGMYIETGSNAIGTGVVTNLAFYNWEMYHVNQGIFVNQQAWHVLVSATWYGRTVLRYWSANALRASYSSGDSPSLHFEHLVCMSPVFDIAASGVHVDGYQAQNGEDIQNLLLDQYDWIFADGDDTSGQGFFSRAPAGAPSNYSLIGSTIGSYIYCGRSTHSLTVNGSDTTHPFSAGQITFITQWSGVYGTSGTGWNNTPGAVFSNACAITLNAGNTNAAVTNAAIQGTVVNTSGTVPTNVTFNSGGGDVSAYLPSATWISSNTLKSTAQANPTAQNYSALDDSRWHGTVDQVLASVVTALTPTLNGALKNVDGTYRGALFPNGTRNDGSVYVP